MAPTEETATVAERASDQEVRLALGRIVKSAREKAGLDITEVARRSKLTLTEVEEIEQGITADAELTVLFSLAEVLHIDPRRFFQVARWEPPKSDDDHGGFVWVKRADDA